MTKQFLPIINFHIGENTTLRFEEQAKLFELSIKTLAKYFPEIEISCSSDGFWNHIEVCKNHPQSNCFGSINSIDIAQKLISELDTNRQYKFFAPAYDSEVADFLKKFKNITYIPGIFTQSDFEEIKENQFIKIFPFRCKDAEDFISILSAPYPEFRKSIYLKKLLYPSQELIEKYKILERITINTDGTRTIRHPEKPQSGDVRIHNAQSPTIYVINSPRDYQKIRSKFLLNPNTKIFIHIQESNCDSLAKSIKQTKYISRIKFEDCVYDNAIVSTRVFNEIVLDILAGHLGFDEIEIAMEEEIKRYL
ncbi:MAG: hypothetical protein LW817_08605 [Candidatus Caenarcaniphilales bacterium]|jgi:hypothetical protein|nr:hypothetical protein [Candidatus Caenarcaniphilales bacterium]